MAFDISSTPALDRSPVPLLDHIIFLSRIMAAMDERNLAHGNTLMHLSAALIPLISSSSVVPVLVVDLRATWSRFSNQSSEVMRKCEEFIFCSTLGSVSRPEALRREVSTMLSYIEHSDHRDREFWIHQICSFATELAVSDVEVLRNHGLVVVADILIEQTEFHAFFEGVQEISEPLTLGEIFEGKEYFPNPPPADEEFSGVRVNEKAIYTTTDNIGSQEREYCAICLEENFEPGVEVTKLPCSHIFHQHCIAMWLHRSPLCPLCRFAMPSGNEKGTYVMIDGVA